MISLFSGVDRKQAQRVSRWQEAFLLKTDPLLERAHAWTSHGMAVCLLRAVEGSGDLGEDSSTDCWQAELRAGLKDPLLPTAPTLHPGDDCQSCRLEVLERREVATREEPPPQVHAAVPSPSARSPGLHPAQKPAPSKLAGLVSFSLCFQQW